MDSSSVSKRRLIGFLLVLAGVSSLFGQSAVLPFGLERGNLDGLRVSLRVNSTKANSGYEEIVISGGGEVIVRSALTTTARPRELSGRVPLAVIERLLELLTHEGAEGWDDNYRSQSHDYAVKSFTVAFRETIRKQVVVAIPEFPEFAHVAGAIKVIAAQACPDALKGRFFRML